MIGALANGESPVLALMVHGHPRVQGNKTAIAVRRKSPDGGWEYTGKAVAVENRSTRDLLTNWREAVKAAALDSIGCHCGEPDCTDLAEGFPITGPVEAAMVFTFERPKSHYRTGRNSHLLREDAPPRPGNVGDTEKLARSTCDALTDVRAWADDKLLWNYRRLAKVYAGEDPMALPRQGAVIYIWPTVGRGEPPIGARVMGQLALDLTTVDGGR